MKLLSRSLSLSLTAALALTAMSAGAQTKVEGFSLELFSPTPAGDAFFAVPAPWVGGHLEPRAQVMFDYIDRPFRFQPSGSSTATDIVGMQGFLRVGGSFALWDRLLVAADVPIALLQSGEAPAASSFDFHPPSGVGIGDVRVDLRGRLLGEYYDPFQLGVTGSVFIPSGSADSYTGDGAVGGAFQLSLGGRVGRSVGFVWNAAGGARLHGAGPLASILFGGGAAVTFLEERIQVGPELNGVIQASGSPFALPGANVSAESTTALEVLIGARARIWKGLMVSASGGPGFAGAVGTPVFRVLGGLSWSPAPERPPEKPPPAVGDKDDDGIRDDVDACPDVKGDPSPDPTKDGCPPADRDGDTVLDVEDACPGEAGIRNADATKSGCPPDQDEDGVADAKDACPEVFGAASSNPKKNGCPADSDDDGVTDAVDACPKVAGPEHRDPKQNGCPEDPDGDGVKYPNDACPNDAGEASNDPKTNGCPKLARLSGDSIVISQQVRFRVYGKSKYETVDPISDDLMKEIKGIIDAHPEIVKIEVQGHTDDMGDEEFNNRLSQERAEAVRKWLIDAGVPASKLVAKGYGMNKPIADNRVRTGRDKNRRVEFVVLERRK